MTPQIAPERGKHTLPSEDLPETFRLPSEEIGNIFWKNLLLEGVGAWRAGLAVALQDGCPSCLEASPADPHRADNVEVTEQQLN